MNTTSEHSAAAFSKVADQETKDLRLYNDDFLNRLQALAKFKDRAHKTHQQVHVPELNRRLQLDLHLPLPDEDASPLSPDALSRNLSNTCPINVIYLGNSMLERFKTTGANTNIGKLGNMGVAWNAGVGGDKNENVAYRLNEGLYDMLRNAKKERCNIRVWILTSGTNNLHAKRPFRKQDVESWRVLVETCLRIAPESMVLACDMTYRKDIADVFVDESNRMLKEVVEEINEILQKDMEKEDDSQGGKCQGDRVKWIDSRHVISKDMLVDHVHLNEEGYRTWDAALWPLVAEVLGIQSKESE